MNAPRPASWTRRPDGSFARGASDAFVVDARGAAVATGRGDAQPLRLRLGEVACDGVTRRLDAQRPESFGPTRAGFTHGGLREWYAPLAAELEQGFDVDPIDGCVSTLVLGVEVVGGHVVGEGPARDVVDDEGQRIAVIDRLAVVDATGRGVPSRFVDRAGGYGIEVSIEGATFPLVVDPYVVPTPTRLLSGAGASVENDELGASVCVLGDVAVVGAPSAGPGLAYVLRRVGGAFELDDVLRASDGATLDGFGSSCALDGTTLVIGAPRRVGVAGTGAVYVFDDTGSSFLETGIVEPASEPHDHFGTSVALAGDDLAVGAPQGTGSNPSAVFLHTRTAGTFTQVQTLTSPDTYPFDEFGSDVAISGDALVVGAMRGVPAGSFTTSGAAYLYRRALGSFGLAASFGDPASTTLDWFGYSVDVDAELIVVGARYLGNAGNVFVYDVNTAAPITTLSAPADVATTAGFGTDVVLESARLTVAIDATAFAVFDRSGASLTGGVSRTAAEVGHPLIGVASDGGTVLTTDGRFPGRISVLDASQPDGGPVTSIALVDARDGGQLGHAVATDGSLLAVASSASTPAFPLFAGSVRVFESSTLTTYATLRPTSANPAFGTAVAVDGGQVFVGQPSSVSKGRVAIYRADGATPEFDFVEGASLTAPTFVSFDGFGASLSVAAPYVVVGAPYLYDGTSSPAAGRAFVFESVGSSWTLRATLVAPDGNAMGAFGSAVAMDVDDVLVTGTTGVYASRRTGTTWSTPSNIAPIECSTCSLAVAGDVAAVGRPAAGAAKNSGVVDIYSRASGAWILTQTLVPAGSAGQDRFGSSVALDDGTLVVGVPGDDGTLVDQGSVRFFTLGSEFVEDGTLSAPDAATGDAFGASVAVRAGRLLVGAPLADTGRTYGTSTVADVGTAYTSTVARDLGTSCSADGDCASGFCVDGVCCESACDRDGSHRCQACTVALGASADGRCEPRPAATPCRPSAGVCDQAETCDGTSTVCPADGREPSTVVCRASGGACDVPESCDGGIDCPAADAKQPSGTVCRISTGACDVAETCDGTSVACPGDGVLPQGSVCRATDGACDVAESCDGVGSACPVDGFVASGTECRASAGVCDVAEACSGTNASCPMNAWVADGSPCDDTLVCTQSSTCQLGVCGATATLDCSDLDPCTTDGCAEPSGCTHTTIVACVGDAGTSLDASADTGTDAAGADASGAPTTVAQGCSCRVGGAPGNPATGVLVVAGWVALAWRTRRRDRSTTRSSTSEAASAARAATAASSTKQRTSSGS